MGTKLVERGITRYDIDDQGTYGYMVRISRGGEHYNQFFSDKNHKGKRKALAAARAHYAKLKASLPAARTTKNVVTSRNQSGVVGVHLAVCESVYGEEYSSYCASWKTPTGQRRKISFAFRKYGKKKSWELACLARQLESTDREKLEKMVASKSKKTRSSLNGTKATKKSPAAKKSVKKKSSKKKTGKKKSKSR